MVLQIPERLAVFVDGENIPAEMFDEISYLAKSLGECLVWKVFGDFSQNSHADWIGICRKHGIQAVMELPSDSGKNSTDIAIVIAAMDVLTLTAVDGLVLVSDDRDFLPLVRRLRAGGMNVHGFGRKLKNPDLSRFHTSWTQLAAKATPKVRTQKVETQRPAVAISQTPPPRPVPKIAAHKIEIHDPVLVFTDVPPPNPVIVTEQAKTTPPLLSDPLAAEFSKAVQTKLAEDAIDLSSLGTWIRKWHPALVPLLGAGKLKKRLSGDGRFVVSGNTVSLAK